MATGKEAAINEQILSCGVCLNQYTDPRRLPCHHSFCKNCIDGFLATNCETNCPTCRFPFQVSSSGAATLPVAFEISNLLEIMSKKYEAETQLSGHMNQTEPQPFRGRVRGFQVCQDHQRPKDMYCDTCDEYVCCKCALEDHHTHQCDRAEFLFTKHKQEIEATLEPMKIKIEELEHTLTRFDTREKELREQEKSLQEDLVRVYKELVDRLQESQRKLSQELSTTTQRKLQRHAVERAQTETALVQMRSFCDYMTDKLKTQSDHQIQADKVELIKQINDAHSMVWVNKLQPTQPDTVFTADKLRATLTQQALTPAPAPRTYTSYRGRPLGRSALAYKRL